jgi:metal-responsive CopG/Arc/MetJ family transcriptional regulator
MLQMNPRPTTNPKPVTLQLRVPQELVDAIDAWANAQDFPPLRSEAIRRLIVLGLKSKVKKRRNE